MSILRGQHGHSRRHHNYRSQNRHRRQNQAFPMRIIPVLDVMKGQVVPGVGGRRHEYRPIVSRLTSATDPVGVAQALAAHFGWRDFYLADLDAILGAAPAFELYRALRGAGFSLWV